MAISPDRMKDMMAVLERTGGHREVAKKARIIPDFYKACLEQVKQEEYTLTFPGVMPVRVIVTTPKDKQENAPLHVNYHGGGFVFKQNADDDMYCAHLAVATGAVVVDVDYAVSTEACYPTAVNQAWECAKWAFAHCAEWGCDEKRFSVGGSSAGGNLAMVVALKNGECHELPLCLLILEYAATDLFQCMDDPLQERSQVFSLLYCDDHAELLKDPMLSQVYATDEQLKGMPQTLIIAPKKCPFYAINQRLGMRMVEQGVKVTFKAYEEAVHGFTIRMVGEDWLSSQQDAIEAIRATSL